MPWYLGRPGAIIQLPAPSRGTQTPLDRTGGTHQLLSGGRVRDSFGVKRSWQFTWQALTRDQIGILDGFVYGTYGPGPYVLLDPEQRNLLAPNVAATTSVTNDSTGFVAGANVTLASDTGAGSTAYAKRLKLTETTSVGIGQIVAGLSAVVPVRPSVSHTFSGIIALGTPAHYPVISWLDAARAQISEADGTVVSSTTTAFAVTGTAPSNAIYADCQLRANAAPTGTSALWVEGLQFEQASSASAWVPGLAVPYVTVDGGGRGRQLINQNDYALTLVEV